MKILQYNIRRHGCIVGIYDDSNKAIAEAVQGDQVFEVVEKYGEWGCMNEYKICNV